METKQKERRFIGYICQTCRGENISTIAGKIFHSCRGELQPVYK